MPFEKNEMRKKEFTFLLSKSAKERVKEIPSCAYFALS